MKIDMTTLDGKGGSAVELADDVFGLEPRADLLQRVVRWQLAKRQQGTHQTKTRGEITGRKGKMMKQKGSGGARHGNRKVPIFRGGGRAMGPQVRSHAHDLPKKIRAMGLRHALSAKAQDGSLVILDLAACDGKTASLKKSLAGLGISNALVIDGAEVNENFARAARNIPNVDVLPSQGANVYDILRRERLVLTSAGVEALEARLK